MTEPKTRTYEFYGEAIVSVVAYIEAESMEDARAILDDEPSLWECDSVDGDVENIECMSPADDEEDEDE